MAHSISDSDTDSTFDPTEIGESASPRQILDDNSDTERLKSSRQKNTDDGPGTSTSQWHRGMIRPKHNLHGLSESDDSDTELVFTQSRQSFNETSVDKSKKDVTATTEHITMANLQRKDTELIENNKSPMCRYGSKCYRKNPSHFKEFRHPFDTGS